MYNYFKKFTLIFFVLFSTFLYGNQKLQVNDDIFIVGITSNNSSRLAWNTISPSLKTYIYELIEYMLTIVERDPQYDFKQLPSVYITNLQTSLDIRPTVVNSNTTVDFYWPENKNPILLEYGVLWSLIDAEFATLHELQNKPVGVLTKTSLGNEFMTLMANFGISPKYVYYADFKKLTAGLENHEVFGIVGGSNANIRNPDIKPTGITFSPISCFISSNVFLKIIVFTK